MPRGALLGGLCTLPTLGELSVLGTVDTLDSSHGTSPAAYVPTSRTALGVSMTLCAPRQASVRCEAADKVDADLVEARKQKREVIEIHLG